MAIDVVVRPAGKCITLVCDLGTPIADAVILNDQNLHYSVNDDYVLVGQLTDAMTDDALLCETAVFVVMDGDFIHSSKSVPFHRFAASE